MKHKVTYALSHHIASHLIHALPCMYITIVTQFPLIRFVFRPSVFLSLLYLEIIAAPDPYDPNLRFNPFTPASFTPVPVKEYDPKDPQVIATRHKQFVERETAYARMETLRPLERTIWLRDRITAYLSTRCPSAASSTYIQTTTQQIARFVVRCRTLMKKNGVTLTRMELLQLINLRPTTLVEIHRVTRNAYICVWHSFVPSPVVIFIIVCFIFLSLIILIVFSLCVGN